MEMTELKEPIIVLRQPDVFTKELSCNGCGMPYTYAQLDLGNRYGKGSSVNVFRLCLDCLGLLRAEVIQKVTIRDGEPIWRE